ncbi:MAG: TonB-dependent receptor plug domain-containing protein [Rikenellaceae bacterium]
MKRLLLLSIAVIISNVVFSQNKNNEKDTTEFMPIGIEEVKVFASYAKNDGRDAVRISNTTQSDIFTRLSVQEFPEILKLTPSVYATKQGGGYGDSRLTLRGFGSENIAVMINGVPINGMENGAIYWSNWAGLADVTSSMQVQRGLGLSKSGVNSVGGSVNIITRSSEMTRNGSVFYGIGNDGYQKGSVMFSSGMLNNGWAFSLSGSYSSGDGYVNGTNFKAWNYFVNITKKIKTNHLLSFTALGAPQWHNRRSNRQLIEDYDSNRDGIRMNTSYGYINGKVVGGYSGYNEYHKPQISLNHFWTINSKSNLATVVYASIATGGGRKIYGKDANMLQYNYKTGKPNPNSSLTPDGLIDYMPVMEANRNSKIGSTAIFTMGTNSHDWYGLNSNYNRTLAKHLNLSAGIDLRYYKGYHFDEITDLLGGEYFINNSLAWREKDTRLGVGDKVCFDNLSKILWTGAYGELEYDNDKFRSFLTVSVNPNSYKREDAGLYGTYSDQDKFPMSDMKTPWRTFVPITAKAGVNYAITKLHSVYANGGYITKAPMFNNIYVNNTPIADPKNEKIATAEIGYNFNSRTLRIGVTGYYTKWMNKSVTKNIGGWNGPKAYIPNINALHKGVEIEVNYEPLQILKLNGFFTYGDWKWINDVNFSMYDQNNKHIGDYNAYIKGLYVGNAPQMSAMLGVVCRPLPLTTIAVNYNFYGRNYADFMPENRVNKDDLTQSWKTPNYSTFDAGITYGFRIGSIVMQLIGNINNIFDTKYISDAQDGNTHTKESAMVWYGFGRTWSVGVKMSF